MRTSWRRLPPKGNQLESWKEAFVATNTAPNEFTVECLYEDVSSGHGQSVDDATDDFLENIRLRIGTLTEMLQFCATNKPRGK